MKPKIPNRRRHVRQQSNKMSLNTNTLRTVIKRLPDPSHNGQIYQAKFPDRVTELNEGKPDQPIDSAKSAYQVINFIAVKYAEDRREWLEWELLR